MRASRQRALKMEASSQASIGQHLLQLTGKLAVEVPRYHDEPRSERRDENRHYELRVRA